MNWFNYLPSEKILLKGNYLSKTLLDWELAELNTVPINNSLSKSPHQWFNTQLKLNNVCEMGAIQTPGSIIMLPWGKKICEQFAMTVREWAERGNYEEYAYPHLIPQNYFDVIEDLIQIETDLLQVSLNRKDAKRKFVLSPSGECSIYHHWHSLIKRKADLPKKIFQCTQYYRPLSSSKRSGGSVFLSMEAGDIFEFHSCFATKQEAIYESNSLLSLFEELTKHLGVFVVWSLRPSWTNRGKFYQWGFGGDAILPSKHSVQVGCTYYQDDIFSRRFNIAYSEGKENSWTSQTTGAISRRLIFAALFQSMKVDGALCLHPNIAPFQVIILLTSYQLDDENIINNLMEEMKKTHIRCQLIKAETKHLFNQKKLHWQRLGIPLNVFVFGRKKHTNLRIVMKRNDTSQEITNITYEKLREMVPLALKDIMNTHKNAEYYKKHVTNCENINETFEALKAHHVVLAPLSADKQSVAAVESWQKGEVLGFCESKKLSPCIYTKKATFTRAFISRRI